jgi:uncharacterized protein (TIGR02996 family)
MRSPSADELALLSALARTPDDEGARLVYGDWLAENGEAQLAELVLVQTELEKPGPLTDERRKRLTARQDELVPIAQERWLARLGLRGLSCRLRRGLPARVEVAAADFVEARLTPIAEVFLPEIVLRASQQHWSEESLQEDLHLLASCANLALVQRLDLSGIGYFTRSGERGAQGFVLAPVLVAKATQSPRLDRLRSLAIRAGGINSKLVGGLVSARLAQLEELDLAANSIGDRGAVALASSPYLAQVRRLDLSANLIGPEGARALHAAYGSRVLLGGQGRPAT